MACQRREAFVYGALSGVVEPRQSSVYYDPADRACGSAAFVFRISLLLRRGAMIYVVVEELIPEAQTAPPF